MANPIKFKYPLYLKEYYNNFKFINVTHQQLVNLRNNNRLIPGMQYRITDYVATTSDPESRSANHPFDIIVVADDTNVLNENARAIQHEGDEYFKHCNLAAWKLKYCIDNDVNRFEWALQEFDGYEIILDGTGKLSAELISDKDNTIEGYNYHFISNFMGIDIDIYTNTLNFEYTDTNEIIICYIKIEEEIGEVPLLSIKYKTQEGGKGVIYEMIDEYNNRAPYDFKGIQFKRYKYDKKYNDVYIRYITSMITSEEITDQIIVPTDIYEWFYLYCSNMDKNIDVSLGSYSYWCPKNCYISDSYYLLSIISTVMKLPNIILNGEDSSKECSFYVGCNCSNITINNYGEIGIKIGDNCHELYLNSFSGEIKNNVEFAIIEGYGTTYIGGDQSYFTVNCYQMSEVTLITRLCRNTKWYNFKPSNGTNGGLPCYILGENNYYSLGS